MAREMHVTQNAFACSVRSDWLRGWREFSQPITEQSETKPTQPRITFGSQMKTASVKDQNYAYKSESRPLSIFLLAFSRLPSTSSFFAVCHFLFHSSFHFPARLCRQVLVHQNRKVLSYRTVKFWCLSWMGTNTAYLKLFMYQYFKIIHSLGVRHSIDFEISTA